MSGVRERVSERVSEYRSLMQAQPRFVLIIFCLCHPRFTPQPLNSTVRVNTEQQDGVLRTSQRTHASTRQVCGTHPYVSASLPLCPGRTSRA